jgi:ubiquinone/menaquinone biosynthesis C-methylase UbiE
MKKRESTVRHWDDFWLSGNLEYVNKITDELEKESLPGKRVLEIGAGSGSTSIALAKLGAIAFCIDYSQNAVELIKKNATENGTGLFCIKADACALPFKTGSFDICFHQGFLEHFRETGAILAEQYRILKKGGLLLVDVPQTFSFYTLRKKLLIAIGKWFAGWETQFSRRSLRTTLEKAGFSFVRAFGRYHFRNIDRIQKRLLGKTIAPKSIEKVFYGFITAVEGTAIGCATAFALGMIVKKEK